MRRLARWLALVMLVVLAGCSRMNSNWRIEVSPGDSKLVPGTKVYAGTDFTIWQIEIDGHRYLVNSSGGIVRHGY